MSSYNLCHRDVKPANILYYPKDSTEPGQYHFELADFGLVNAKQCAKTFCGTPVYQAPELFRQADYSITSQSPKMDIWSLFATLMDVHPRFNFPPRDPHTYSEILEAIRGAADKFPNLSYMAREDPAYRPNAAQLLVKHFDGEGRTTTGNLPPMSHPPQTKLEYPVEMDWEVKLEREDTGG